MFRRKFIITKKLGIGHLLKKSPHTLFLAKEAMELSALTSIHGNSNETNGNTFLFLLGLLSSYSLFESRSGLV